MTTPTDPSAERIVLDALGAALAQEPADARIAIAYSGGLDSTVLLDATVRIAGAARCVAFHIHHGLSANADRWLAHCEEHAAALGVSFAARHVDVRRDPGVSLEAAARDARYRALDALCDSEHVRRIWLAQHADDQAETVLLQLLRGAGLAGLAAMAPEYRPAGAAVTRVRPLLHVLRAQLEDYARARALRWIDDESNADTRFARNALRHHVLPQLAVHFPGFRDALARTAAHAAAAQRLVDELARLDLQAVASEDGQSLSRDALLAFGDERALNLLRYWMRALGLPAASTARLTDALRQLRDVHDDHGLRVDHAGQTLRSYRGQIYWEAGDSGDPADETALIERPVSELTWRGEPVWRLPAWRGTFVFTEVAAGDPLAAEPAAAIPATLLTNQRLRVRARSGGERMRCDAHGPSRTLKNLFQERGVPSWKRDVPLLFVDDLLLFVPLLGVNLTALDALHANRAKVVQRADEQGGAAERRIRIDWREDLLIA
ncbi:tRNA lysidine(34) synthetase TilS [Paraburkholderia rhizosphaerae]|uniref:tRNA(Ile)-lysidine synthase n=1 Tax=Paraburkholderia rhizosphaerae TaxID=480658 RepID=A0A4R8LKH5_9BURK|nr:tRNA lysidine(34) synthetase TilS [Paraburkholderia rhizosphaerae]TDY45053.1 tRNA(Ile)-lysidine synthase [Paraburkholderia rhizosphaerae]